MSELSFCLIILYIAKIFEIMMIGKTRKKRKFKCKFSEGVLRTSSSEF